MAKCKKATVWKNVLVGMSLLLAIAALSMVFFETVRSIDGDKVFKGYEVAFYCFEWKGLHDGAYKTVDIIWQFSFSNFMGYALLVLGIICCVGALTAKKQGLVLAVLTMLFFIGAGLSFVDQVGNLQPFTHGLKEYLVEMNPEWTNNQINAAVNDFILAERAKYQVSWGATVGAICSFTAAGIALLSKIVWQIIYKKESEEK